MKFRDDKHMTLMKIAEFFKIAPPPLSYGVQNSSTPLILDVQFQMNAPSPNENQ